jgi:cellulose synthase/poly-beta-1,6-N-acetylglucosamine synthase-like glycosyltransferase
MTASVVVISKDEPSLARTLDDLAAQLTTVVPTVVRDAEVVVVDASSGRLDEIRRGHPSVRWIDFRQPNGFRVTIAHQRNRGVAESRGDVVVFTDCGCVPSGGWLLHLLQPIVDGTERMVCGRTGATGRVDPYHGLAARASVDGYVDECPTCNLAVHRAVFQVVGSFDEAFEYGSDVDFCRRAVDAGIRIRYVPEAIVLHDWGTRRRQIRRSYVYGKARARLLCKRHLPLGGAATRRRLASEDDVVAVAYALFILGLPLALKRGVYLALLLIPLWRNRRRGPLQALVDHLVVGAGVLAGAAQLALDRPRKSR